MGSAKVVEFDEATGQELQALSRGRRVEARLKQRAEIVLLAAEGHGTVPLRHVRDTVLRPVQSLMP